MNGASAPAGDMKAAVEQLTRMVEVFLPAPRGKPPATEPLPVRARAVPSAPRPLPPSCPRRAPRNLRGDAHGRTGSIPRARASDAVRVCRRAPCARALTRSAPAHAAHTGCQERARGVCECRDQVRYTPAVRGDTARRSPASAV